MGAVLSSCEKNDAAPSATPASAALRGSWQWKSSFCGWSGASSPATSGRTETLLFDPLGHVQLYRNGVLQSSSVYTLSRHQSMLTQAPADFIRFDNREFRYEINNTTLTLSMDVYDGCNSSYEQQAQ
ncbi:hypothetical protein SAMN02746009_02983 [Hymenobacter psychrotolerans DSM 18569]|uniref:Lipocalin-like domain-containing protein n=2 Tax=Hymenobacter psychrotolerans TaxID=344998 RepID=A0A1M7BNJ6_9BACT|nr:hypothetical protein SAMN02746009_02983 [Hymenobacter psychrotolerans DSM 18569]